MTLAAELARCDREIAEAAAYTGPDELGALHGWTDWMIEKEMILKEMADLNNGGATGTGNLKAPFP